MSKRRKHQQPEITFAGACDLMESALSDGLRPRLLEALSADGDFSAGVSALRRAMRSHTFPTGNGAGPLRLDRLVQRFDARARRSGLHALESWDYVAHRFASEITPVLMLDRCALDGVPIERRHAALAVLLDHYFLTLLGLVVTCAWAEGEPNANLDRATGLLHLLQGRDGGPCRFVDDVETLLLVAISHYSPDEQAYEVMAQRFDALTDARRRRMAHACAAVLGGHLRWGLRFMYRRDLGLMREDNVVDYPLVIFGLLNLLRDFEAERSAGVGGLAHARTVEAVLNGLSADPAFAAGKTPAWLRTQQAEHREMRERLLDHRDALLEGLAAHEPSARAYTPLGFDANFLCNAVTAMIATALAEEGPRPTINALFTGLSPDSQRSADAERQARALMGYAVRNRVAADAPLIVYDPHEAAHAFNMVRAMLRQSPPGVGRASG